VPTYEYACESCGKRYEKREGFDAPPRQKCQHCGKTARRVLHAPPIVFKGSGFYKTDNRGTSRAATDSGSGASTSNSASDSAPDSSDAATTETAAAG